MLSEWFRSDWARLIFLQMLGKWPGPIVPASLFSFCLASWARYVVCQLTLKYVCMVIYLDFEVLLPIILTVSIVTWSKWYLGTTLDYRCLYFSSILLLPTIFTHLRISKSVVFHEGF